MIISCVKWGDKFSHEHVNRLYRMVRKYMPEDFTFICHTDNPTGIYPIIKTIQLDEELELENWWWKLQLFDEERWPLTKHNKHLFFDLDVVIQNDLQPIIDCIQDTKLTFIKCFWKTYPLNRDDDHTKPAIGWDMDNNSSVMAWSGDLGYCWRKFRNNKEKYLKKYNGIDGFLTVECADYMENFPRGLIYSRLYGVDADECFEPIRGNQPFELFHEPDYVVCIFNGWRREKYPVQIFPEGRYWLDDDGYYGMEHYYELENFDYYDQGYYNFNKGSFRSFRDQSGGINRLLWNAMWEVVNEKEDIVHFLDSLSPNQIKSKIWLLEKIADTVKTDIRKVQLWGGWFGHPITTFLNQIYELSLIENIDMDERALHYCRIINEPHKNVDTTHANVMDKNERDWDIDLVINTSSEHMPKLPEILSKRKFRTTESDTLSPPCIFAIQSNNMFHIDDHINCVNNEDELVENTGLKNILYKGTIDMPNGYQRFMVIGHA